MEAFFTYSEKNGLMIKAESVNDVTLRVKPLVKLFSLSKWVNDKWNQGKV